MPIFIAFTLLAGEAGARIVGPNISRRSGSEERAFIKADQIYARGSNSTDVAILGSSESAGGLIPRLILEEAPSLSGGYNAALAGSPLDLTREWADRIVLPGLKPAVVVISMLPVSTLDGRDLDVDPATDPRPSYRSAFGQIDPGGLGSVGWRLRQRSALVRYRPYLRQPTKLVQGVAATVRGGDSHATRVRNDTRMDWRTEHDPARVLANTRSDGEVLDYRDPSPLNTDNGPALAVFRLAPTLTYRLEELARLVSTVRAHGAVPVITMAPLDRVVLGAAGVDLAFLDDLAGRIGRWGVRHEVPVFDQFTVEYPVTAFHDRQHVALAGARTWSRRLGAWLEQQCRRGALGESC